MRVFGIDHDRLLSWPIKRFWFYNKMVDRVRAEEDLRLVHLLASATSGEAYGKAIEGLERQMGEIVVLMPVSNTFDVDGPDPEYERGKLLNLKAKLARQ